MSATSRRGTYEENAAYYTRIELARFLVNLLPIWSEPRRVLEPHVGTGNFLTAVTETEAKHGVFHRLYGLDVDPSAAGIQLARDEGGWGAVGDFLTAALPARPDVVLGNPPYSIPQAEITCPKCKGTGWVAAKHGDYDTACQKCGKDGKRGTGLVRPKPLPVAAEHIRRALEVVRPGGHVAFLLRMGILEGRDRLALWREFPPRRIYALSTRPVFVGSGSDQTSYGFFHWEQGYQGDTALEVVDWNPVE